MSRGVRAASADSEGRESCGAAVSCRVSVASLMAAPEAAKSFSACSIMASSSFLPSASAKWGSTAGRRGRRGLSRVGSGFGCGSGSGSGSGSAKNSGCGSGSAAGTSVEDIVSDCAATDSGNCGCGESGSADCAGTVSGVNASDKIRDEAELGTNVGGLSAQASVVGGATGAATSGGRTGVEAVGADFFAAIPPKIGRRDKGGVPESPAPLTVGAGLSVKSNGLNPVSP